MDREEGLPADRRGVEHESLFLGLITEGLSSATQSCIENEAIVLKELSDLAGRCCTSKSIDPEPQCDLTIVTIEAMADIDIGVILGDLILCCSDDEEVTALFRVADLVALVVFLLDRCIQYTTPSLFCFVDISTLLTHDL